MEHQTNITDKQESIAMPQCENLNEKNEVRPNPAPPPSSATPVAECRRSSRKKIIKFDVRDLLNKNRKPHKIQIEARIDSNAPNTNTKAGGSAATGEAVVLPSTTNTITNPDLSSKQKVFMEKSAIFRRYSVSQEQVKPPPPPPPPLPLPPTILSKVCDNPDTVGALNGSVKRLNRSQEYYKSALLKPKQTTSLIVAQVESNVRSVDIKGPGLQALDTLNRVEQPQQKKRGRPPKVRLNESGKKSPNISTSTETEPETSFSPEKATNWKEYKACLAEHHKQIDKPLEEMDDKSENIISSPSVGASKTEDVKKVINFDCISETTTTGVQKQDEDGLKVSKKTSEEYEQDMSKEDKPKDFKNYVLPKEIEVADEFNDKAVTTNKLDETLITCDIMQQNISSTERTDDCSTLELCESFKNKEDLKSPSEEKIQIVDKIKRSERLKGRSGDISHKQNIKESNSRRRTKSSKQNVEDIQQEEDEKSSETSVENSCSDTLSVSDIQQDCMDHQIKDNLEYEENKNLDSLKNKKTKNSKQNTQQRKSLRKQIKSNKDDQNLLPSSTSSESNILTNSGKLNNQERKSSDQYETKEISSNDLKNETSSMDTAVTTLEIIEDNGNQITDKDIYLKTESESKKTDGTENIFQEYTKVVLEQKDETVSNSPQDILKHFENLDDKSKEQIKSPCEIENQQPHDRVNANENPTVKDEEIENDLASNRKEIIHQYIMDDKSKEQIKSPCESENQKTHDHGKANENPTVTDEEIENNLASNRKEIIHQRESLSNEIEHISDLSYIKSDDSILIKINENITNSKKEETIISLKTTPEEDTKNAGEPSICLPLQTVDSNQELQLLTENTDELTILDQKDTICCPDIPNKEKLSFVIGEDSHTISCEKELNDAASKILVSSKQTLPEFDVVSLTTVDTLLESDLSLREENNPTENVIIETTVKENPPEDEKKNKIKSLTKRISLRNKRDTAKTLNTNEITSKTESPEESISKLKTLKDTTMANEENLVNLEESRTITPLSECSQTSMDESSSSISVIKKKPTRKSRFKNLHNSDSDPDNIPKTCSGTESTAVINEMKQSITTNAKENPKQQSPPEEKTSPSIEDSQNEISDIQSSHTEPTNTYVIKNLSIETNTLLDILRTVQSNEEAAVEAKKLCDPIVERQDSEESSESCSIKTCKGKNTLSDMIASSPCRSVSGSPLTTSSKKFVNSPCGSETSSSSPLTVSRSNTSSPLSLNKKITRRLDRRSRGRGDESTHKTLEETFAEIAALSSKAVLEMSNIIEEEKEHSEVTEDDRVTNEIEEKLIENVSKQDEKDFKTLNENKQTEDDDTEPNLESSVTISAICSHQQNLVENIEKTVDNLKENTVDSKNLNEIVMEVKDSDILISEKYILENKELQQKEDKANIEENIVSTTELSIALDTNFIEELKVTIPKDESKLRDNATGSSNKNESKTTNKKSSKKIKNSDPETNSKTQTPKRGRKPKLTASNEDVVSPVSNNNCGSKKKLKKEQTEIDVSTIENKSELIVEKALDEERLAKKSRQRKLKEAFEAALADKNPMETNTLSPPASPSFESLSNNSQCPTEVDEKNTDIDHKDINPEPCQEAEEVPDPLKDIEKFIEDGVNLLKKAYKIDEDSVDNVIITNEKSTQQNEETDVGTIKKNLMAESYETPADTPLATPSVTPPPKSPEHQAACQSEENSSGGVRRSHRLKLITKTPKALVGRGLVKDKERFSIKDDVETKTHYTLDDHLLDLAEVEAKNAKFLKEMEERLSNFHVIKENEYQCERVISREARKMICDCFLTAEEEERGELGCGEDCLNRLLMIECGLECNVRERCTNKRFQKLLCSPCRVFRTEKKGFGIMADIEILPGEFIMEYVGEVIDTEEFERRRIAYSQDKNRHYYFMALRSDAIIDATIKGNISRFINHSCDPNAETQKWTVNGELRIGFFSRKSIMPGEEITFNYQYQRYGREAQRCYCESSNCRGWIGQEPTSDEGEQIDDEEDDESDDEEDEDNTNLLEDDDDSDASVSDPEMVQKKLELAAAQAAVELAPLDLMGPKTKEDVEISGKEKEEESFKTETEEEDSKSKFKKLLSKMAEKVAAKQKQSKREQKLQRKKKSKESTNELLVNKQRSLEDPDIEDEVEFLSRCGLKNQSDTLRLSRLMVRAKLVQTRLNLLAILRKGELPCRRLFLDYHGLRLVHGWMSEDAGNMEIRLALLQTLETLPIANKTVLTDSKVMQVVKSWCGTTKNELSPNEDSQSSNSNSQDGSVATERNTSGKTENILTDSNELQKLALKLAATWDGLPEIFRIPKKERIEQMKEHEREADRQYAETERNRQTTTDRFSKRVSGSTTKRFNKPHSSKPQILSTCSTMMMRHPGGNMGNENSNYISKAQRRELFAAKVARDEAEKRLVEERREFETKCRFFGLEPKKTRLQDMPFCVNPATGQWYSVERKPITTPPSYAHVQIPERQKSTNPVDYQLPSVCSTLPPAWKYAITPTGQIYYYHVQYRIPQWDPPSAAQLNDSQQNNDEDDSGNEQTTTTGPESSDDDDTVLVGMDAAQLKAYIERKVEARRQKRYQRLVDERAISPRREEDRIYNQVEVRKYKENKEKIRKRKEEIRRKRAEALRHSSLNLSGNLITESNNSNTSHSVKDNDNGEDTLGVLPIQDYLLSSDEDDEDIKIEVNSPLIDKIVEGDKIVDELDALTTKRQLKRPLPPHREINEASPSTSTAASILNSITTARETQDYKKRKMEKKDKRKCKEQDLKYRKTKEKFRCEIAGIIVHHLKPYRKETCSRGRIQSNEDFNHLARKLTHFVMIKELKYCESVGQTLVVTESVKNKSREFIKKYMTKYGDVYVKPLNDPEFKDIPFKL